MAKPKEDIITRIRKFEKEYQALLVKYNLKPSVHITFPIYNVLPKEIELALEVIKKHDPVYRIAYTNKEE